VPKLQQIAVQVFHVRRPFSAALVDGIMAICMHGRRPHANPLLNEANHSTTAARYKAVPSFLGERILQG
jgi:hypothetical protein